MPRWLWPAAGKHDFLCWILVVPETQQPGQAARAHFTAGVRSQGPSVCLVSRGHRGSKLQERGDRPLGSERGAKSSRAWIQINIYLTGNSKPLFAKHS